MSHVNEYYEGTLKEDEKGFISHEVYVVSVNALRQYYKSSTKEVEVVRLFRS